MQHARLDAEEFIPRTSATSWEKRTRTLELGLMMALPECEVALKRANAASKKLKAESV